MTEEVSQETPTFDVLDLRPTVRQAIDDLGWDNPTPVQVACYGKAITGRDLIVQSRTGTGKTAAFGLPLVDRLVSEEGGVQALIVATEWEQVVNADWADISRCMRPPRFLFDGRNALDPLAMESLGFEYQGVGRGSQAGPSPRTNGEPV